MVYFRGKDSYTTQSKYLEGDVCLYNARTKQKLKTLFSKKNSKKPKKQFTAYDYFIKEQKGLGEGVFLSSNVCKGVDEEKIWKGTKYFY